MKLSVRGLALAAGLLWGGSILGVGLLAAWWGVRDGGYYGQDFLLMVASLYPGFRGVPEYGDALVGAGYGLLDGSVAGALFAWLYNLAAGGRRASAS